MPRSKVDPAGFYFALEIPGVFTSYFSECSGLGSEHEVIEMREGGDENRAVIKMPGRLKWENIVLKRGISSNMDIWEWRKKMEAGNLQDARRNGSIVMYNKRRKEVARWNFQRAWPVKVTGPQPKADSNEIGIEEITIAHESIERVR